MRGSQSTEWLEVILNGSGDSPLCVNVNIAPGAHDTKWSFLPIFLAGIAWSPCGLISVEHTLFRTKSMQEYGLPLINLHLFSRSLTS